MNAHYNKLTQLSALDSVSHSVEEGLDGKCEVYGRDLICFTHQRAPSYRGVMVLYQLGSVRFGH